MKLIEMRNLKDNIRNTDARRLMKILFLDLAVVNIISITIILLTCSILAINK